MYDPSASTIATAADGSTATPSRGTRPPLIRQSVEADVSAMLAIYSHHIQRGLGPFDVEPLHPEELKRRRKAMLKRRLPHLVAEVDGLVAGYAYAAPFRKRPAYRYTVEHSIYVHKDHLGHGIGRLLLPALIDACTLAGCRQMIAVVDSANLPSLRLHEGCGFERAGILRAVGFKFGRWTDSIFLQRPLGAADRELPDDHRGGTVQAAE
ncbi:phosphinothricin acetyltransferase [Azospirillum picis]|uniref:Phosphinothricin acetyltransferase n=1 Tax=Azospirillum picis TaxID=488438 RepID=A0ABU0MN57_9PROT|nr:phosphinothricin acetyltransferase [Azospirillum picis]MDQ0534769.1 phosphinothricin acetyltransferase [Azospirillum picis]